MTSKEWDYVHCRVLKRKFIGKESEIFFTDNEYVVPQKKVKKELSRRYTITEDQACVIGNKQFIASVSLEDLTLN